MCLRKRSRPPWASPASQGHRGGGRVGRLRAVNHQRGHLTFEPPLRSLHCRVSTRTPQVARPQPARGATGVPVTRRRSGAALSLQRARLRPGGSERGGGCEGGSRAESGDWSDEVSGLETLGGDGRQNALGDLHVGDRAGWRWVEQLAASPRSTAFDDQPMNGHKLGHPVRWRLWATGGGLVPASGIGDC